ncbi:hypothetical protein FACS1894208_11490 [Clostridia bacterium]|nr:hypothetical protein FACS1894208_11490 [Clostridia bacterium]
MRKKQRDIIIIAAVIALAAVAAVLISLVISSQPKSEAPQDVSPSAAILPATPSDTEASARPLYPDWADIVPSATDSSLTSVPDPDPAPIYGLEDLDERGEPFPPFEFPSPTVVPIYQDESEATS